MNLYKIATSQDKTQCVSWFIESKSDLLTQRNYRTNYVRDPPSRPSICAWLKKFVETRTVLEKGRSGRPRPSEKTIDRIRQLFTRSLTRSVGTAARQLELLRLAVHKVLHKSL